MEKLIIDGLTEMDEKIKQVIEYKAPYELTKGHEADSGYDVRLDTRSFNTIFIMPFETVNLPTGVYLNLSSNYEAQVRPKSGLSSKGLLVHFGTVDSGYRGEVLVIVTNLTSKPFGIQADEKIAQLVFVKKDIVELEQVEEISNDTTRGTGGFGSTGRF